jgi:ribose transport system substrate-binding protein
MTLKTSLTKALLFAAGLVTFAGPALADGIEDTARAPYYDAFKGKTIAYLPLSMGMDITEAWGAMIQRQADELGYKVIVRDPNWSTDAGSRALTELIAEKPDLMVVQNPDVQSYARLLKKAQKAGIYVIQVNMKSSFMTESFAGPDWVKLGEVAANLQVQHCGAGTPTSHKVAIIQGVLTAAASVYQIKGVMNVLSQHPDIKIVSNQAADWDATKARAIAATVLQQDPDVCGIIGFWDGQDSGTGAAIREAGKQDKVLLTTSGGGAQTACDGIQSGIFGAYINYDAVGQGRDINAAIRMLLQAHPAVGTVKFPLYSQMTILTKTSLHPNSCWDTASLKIATPK